MKIVHVCLCGPVSDNWNYQENMLTKYQIKLGYEVTLVAPQWAWGSDGKMIKVDVTEYVNSDGVKMIRLPIQGEKDVMFKFKKYIGLYNTIEKENPDVIFIHNVQFFDIKQIALYAKTHLSVKIFVDNHADFSNSARNWIAKNILYGFLWRHCAHVIERYTRIFYGVLPSRVTFIKDVYKIPPDKVELLLMGADDELVKKTSKPEVKEKIRLRYGISSDDFLVVTGGKIDAFKSQTLLLMEAIKNIRDIKVKLLLFGSVSDELKDQVQKLVDGTKIQYIGWITSEQSYEYFAAADLVIFPGRHSVFWEQVVGQGIPMIVKYWDGITHIDFGGNVKFLYQDSAEEIQQLLMDVISDSKRYAQMKRVAQKKGMKVFSYREIAKKSIGE